jgi:hypothetical protein
MNSGAGKVKRMDFLTPLSQIEHSIVVVKRLLEVAEPLGNKEIIMLLTELDNELAEIKARIDSLQNQGAVIIEEKKNLEQLMEAKQEKPTRVLYGCYQFANDTRLYCKVCFDTKGQKVRASRLHHRGRGSGYTCPACGTQLS